MSAAAGLAGLRAALRGIATVPAFPAWPGAPMPAEPDRGLLVTCFGALPQIARARVDEIDGGSSGGFLFLTAAEDAEEAAMVSLTADLARRGIALLAPDLIRDRMLTGGMAQADLRRWRQLMRDAAVGVVVLQSPAAEQSRSVWADVCAALASRRPVWVLRPGEDA